MRFEDEDNFYSMENCMVRLRAISKAFDDMFYMDGNFKDIVESHFEMCLQDVCRVWQIANGKDASADDVKYHFLMCKRLRGAVVLNLYDLHTAIEAFEKFHISGIKLSTISPESWK